MNSLADLGLRRARVAALIMWRAGLRVGETVALEWRDIDLTAGTLLVRRGKGGRGRTVPLHLPLWPRIFAAEYLFRRQRKRGTRAERPSWVPGCSHTAREGWGGLAALASGDECAARRDHAYDGDNQGHDDQHSAAAVRSGRAG